MLTIGEYEYGVASTFVISPKVLELTSNYTEPYIYNSDQQNPEISTTNVIPDDSVELIVNVPTSKNAGTYSVTVTGLKEGSNPNYVLPTDSSKLTFAYTIAPRPVTIVVGQQTTIRIDNKFINEIKKDIDNFLFIILLLHLEEMTVVLLFGKRQLLIGV